MFNDILASVSSALESPLFSFGLTQFNSRKLLLAFFVLLATHFLIGLILRAIARFARSGRSVVSPSGLYALSRILLYVGWIIGAIVVLQILGINLTSLAFFGGAVGIGIGLGLQSVFSNFVSGIILLLEKTLKVGDFVELESGAAGRVSEINVRFTRITTNDLVDILVPNSEFTNGRVKNWSYEDPHRRIHVPFTVAYNSDKHIVRKAGLAAASAVEGTVNSGGRNTDVWLVGFGESALKFELIVWVGQEMASAPGRTQARYLWALEGALREHGLVVPFPQREVRLHTQK